MVDVDAALHEHFPIHPFTKVPDEANYETLMAHYLAMSLAFPYLQAGSQSEVFSKYMNENVDIPKHVELTTIVGNFLCWDETGGLNLTLASGLKGLPRLLETKRFHANVLRKDCEKLFGHAVQPDFGSVTKIYLNELYIGLSAECPVTRVAHMVAFESHAHHMIESLWGSLVDKFGIDKNKLAYFAVHVGDDDPAEPYHVEMTQALIREIVAPAQEAEFKEALIAAYRLNSKWCADVNALSCEKHHDYAA